MFGREDLWFDISLSACFSSSLGLFALSLFLSTTFSLSLILLMSSEQELTQLSLCLFLSRYLSLILTIFSKQGVVLDVPEGLNNHSQIIHPIIAQLYEFRYV